MKALHWSIICFALIQFCYGYTWDKYIPTRNISVEDIRDISQPVSSEGLSPVILVPGLGGTKMQAKLNRSSVAHWWCLKKSDYYNIWAVWYRVMPGLIECWMDNMKLTYDNVNHKAKSIPGVNFRFPDWKRPEAVKWVSNGMQGLFDNIVDALVGNDYVRGKNIYGAPYDFRKGPKEQSWWFDRMKRISEHAFHSNKRVGVTYVGHSMGGRMILQFLQQMPQSWKDKYVKRAIFLGVPWGGCVLAMKAMVVGHNPAFYMSPIKMKKLFETFSSLAWLIPSEQYWNSKETLATIGNKSYTTANLDEFFTEIGNPNAYEMRKDQSIYNSSMAPGVEVHCLYGSVNNTLERLDFGDHFNSYPKRIMGQGDGYVNKRSLLGFERWQNSAAQGNHGIYQQEFPGIDHVNIVDNKDAIDYILKELKDDRKEFRKLLFKNPFHLRIPIF